MVAVIPFEDEEDAMRLANDTVYGLSGSVWTRTSPAPCASPAASRPASSPSTPTPPSRVATPFGGMKQSGVGRELGPHALDYYTEVKNVYLSTEED